MSISVAAIFLALYGSWRSEPDSRRGWSGMPAVHRHTIGSDHTPIGFLRAVPPYRHPYQLDLHAWPPIIIRLYNHLISCVLIYDHSLLVGLLTECILASTIINKDIALRNKREMCSSVGCPAPPVSCSGFSRWARPVKIKLAAAYMHARRRANRDSSVRRSNTASTRAHWTDADPCDEHVLATCIGHARAAYYK